MEVTATDIIVDGMVAYLTQKLYDEPEDNKIHNIRAGRLQEDPTALSGYNILVHDEPEGHFIQPSLNRDNGRQSAPPHMIGGGSFWFMQFQLELVFHFKGERSRKAARTKAHVLLSRLRYALETMPMPTHPDTGKPKDDFGESVISAEVGNHVLRESGGPGHYIWKGNLEIEFLTETLSTI